MDYGRPALIDRLAADYAAGTLRGGARRRLEALLPAHPALQRATALWQARLMPLTAVIEPQLPPPDVWRRVQQRLGFAGVAVAAAWWTRTSVWRGWAALTTIAAAALAVLVVLPEPARPPVIVVLSAAAATPAASGAAAGIVPASFVASISADGRAAVTRPLVPVGVQPDRALELWAIPPSGAPRSLGLIDAQVPTVVHRGKLLKDTAALAVSLEPVGGSPSGAPTGPVLYIGKLPT